MVKYFMFCFMTLSVSLSVAQEADAPRTIEFSGITWAIWGPEKNGLVWNDWSDSPEGVWVDEDGRLHMKLRNVNGQWQSTLVTSTGESLYGYGDYRFQVVTDTEATDPSVNIGLYTYANTGREDHEIDIELTRFRDPQGPTGHYAVQPWEISGHTNRFDLDLPQDKETTHRFVWSEDSVLFQSYRGHITLDNGSVGLPEQEALIHEWRYTMSQEDNRVIPTPRPDESLNLNIFHLRNSFPEQDHEFIIRRVSYEPEATVSE